MKICYNKKKYKNKEEKNDTSRIIKNNYRKSQKGNKTRGNKQSVRSRNIYYIQISKKISADRKNRSILSRSSA